MGQGYSIKAKANSEADIFLYEDVGESFFGGVSAKQFAGDLKGLGKVGTINVHISSLGGDVHEGLAIYRQLADHGAKVVSYIDGWAASIASVIAMAGSEIKIAEAGAVMIHDAWGMAAGNAADFRRLADMLEANTGAIADVYVARTGNKAEQVKEWMSAETWFYGKDAVEKGFASEVMPNVKISAHFDPSKHKFKNAPVALGGARPLYDEAKQRLTRLKTLKASTRILAA